MRFRIPKQLPRLRVHGSCSCIIFHVASRSGNPWASLDEAPPYIAVADRSILDDEHRRKYRLRCDVLPHAWLGNPRSAHAILLHLNPGFSERDVDDEVHIPEYRKTVRLNLSLENRTSFWALDPKLASTSAACWWRPKLRPLACGLGPSGWQLIQRRLAVVEYFPYHSVRYRWPPRLPSQEFGFDLVRLGLARGATVLVMRQWESWRAAVPELIDHPRVLLNPHPRQPTISEANLGTEIFRRLVTSIRMPRRRDLT